MKNNYVQIAGAGGGDSGGGGGGRSSVEDADSLQSRAMLSLLDLIGEGQIGGLIDGAKSIYFDNTPLINPDGTENYKGVTWETRSGTQDQSVIPDASQGIESPYGVNVKVRYDTPHSVTINNPNATQARVVVAFPSLIYQEASTGDIHGTSVSYRIDVSADGGPYVMSGDVLTVSGKTRSKYQRNHLINLPKPASTWSIRLTRLTADSADTHTNNDMYFDSFAEIVSAPLSYPNSALVSVTIDSAQLNRIPTRAYLVAGLYVRVPSNYNAAAKTYSGYWDGTFKMAVTSNPAWILYDVLTNPRYGLGQFISAIQVDKAKLYQIGRYCDESVPNGFGGTEPRFAINTAIQSQSEAYKLISDITSVFRGMGYWDGSMVGLTYDAPSDASMVFSPSNVIDGVFTYTGQARKDRHSVVLVTWNDPAERYRQKVEYVEDAELVAQYGIRKVEVVAFGCTSRGQAHRVGKWMLYTEKHESNVVTFKVGMDAANVLPGEVVKIHDPYRAGKRMGGRLAAATLTSATLDAEITLADGGGLLSVRLPDGTFAERQVHQLPGKYTVLTWSEPLPALPLDNAVWLVAETNLRPMLARVVSLTQDTETKGYAVAAIEHIPGKYGTIERNLALELPRTSIIDPMAVVSPSNIKVEAVEYLVAPNVIGSKLYVSWVGSEPSYELSWRRTGAKGTNWATITTTSAMVELENVRAGTHEFVLRSINGLGYKSTALQATFNVTTRTSAPGDVVNFQARRRIHDIMLSWDAVQDISVLGYEVRFGKSWDSSVVLTERYAGTTLVHDVDAAGTYYYHIRSINTSGEYSENVMTAVLELAAPSAVAQFDCVQSGVRLEFKWLPNQEQGITGYEIREGSSWDTSQFISQVLATSYTIPAGGEGVRTFWIKAIASPGIYGDTPTFVTTAVAQPTNVNVVWQDDEETKNFPGVRHFATQLGTSLMMDLGVQRSEYLFDVDLGAVYRGQNTLFGTISALTYDSMTWADAASFTWADPDANRPWIKSASSPNTVSARFQIAPYLGLVGKEIDGWRLSGPNSVAGSGPKIDSYGLKYDKGRYGNGLLVDDMTRASWPVAIPSQFNTVFWFVPKEIANSVIWRATNAAGDFLKLGYSTKSEAFKLTGSDGKVVTIPYKHKVGQALCFGIVQTATKRSLMIGKMGLDPAVEAHVIAAPIADFNTVALF